MKIYLLVANSCRASLYRCESLSTKGLILEREFEHPESRAKGTDLASDGQGRVFSDHGPRCSHEEVTSPKEYESKKFAIELVDIIKNLNIGTQSEYKFVLVAPSKFYRNMKLHFGSNFSGF